MDQRTEPIRQDIDTIRDSMTDKMEQIESKIKGTVKDTRRMVDIKYQVSQRPWAALGTSILIGYAIGSIGGSEHKPLQHQHGETMRYYGEPSDERSRAMHDRETSSRSISAAQHQDARQQSKPGFLDQIMDQFGDEIELLKGAALASVTGLVRDTIHRNLPALQQEVDRMRGQQSSSASPTTSRSYATAGMARNDESSKYYDTANQPLRERSVGEMSTQMDVGRSPNYDFIPPAPHAEPGGRP
jgi:hypothetical protein